MSDERILIDWKGLKAIGWPYCRQHTYRLIDRGVVPAPLKFGTHPGARTAWRWKDIRNYLDSLPTRIVKLDDDS